MAFVHSLPLARSPFAASPATTTTTTPRRPARAAPAHRPAPAPRMLVLDAGSKADVDSILAEAEDALVVIDYSTTWCGPCKVFAPVFQELSEAYTDVVFVKVEGDASKEASELMNDQGIRAVPAFHFWKGKERVKTFTGARREEIESTIKSLK